jgi:hypothetical protein
MSLHPRLEGQASSEEIWQEHTAESQQNLQGVIEAYLTYAFLEVCINGRLALFHDFKNTRMELFKEFLYFRSIAGVGSLERNS